MSAVTCTLGDVTPTPLLPGPRLGVRGALLRWVLVSLVLTGVIAMHVLSQHDAAGGHHGAIIDQSAATAAVDAHAGHGAADTADPATAGTPMLMPVAPSGPSQSMAACILFLVIGAGAVLLALLAALRRRTGSSLARTAGSLLTVIPRGPPYVGPPRISLCVLRV